jgi:adenylosuccinate synthase
MPVSVIFGGQFGSEGKGKTAHFFASYLKAKAVIRVGGPNSGHTVIDSKGQPLILKQLPTASIIKGVYSVITSGNYLNVEILLNEIRLTCINEDYLYIDPFAVIISKEDLEEEATSGLKESIGSTGSGIGAAVSRRVNRNKNLRFAKDEPQLKKYIRNTNSFLRYLLEGNERVIIEGTQGFGLSLLHSGLYPFTTSRDTSAAAFVSESGLSPLDVDDVIMVIRSFPIRVGGNSGPLPSEVSWDTVSEISGSSTPIIELTSVTKKVRRVAEFDPAVVKKAIEINRPTRIVLNHVDYYDFNCGRGYVTVKAMNEIHKVESMINKEIDFIGIDRLDLINAKEKYQKSEVINKIIA